MKLCFLKFLRFCSPYFSHARLIGQQHGTNPLGKGSATSGYVFTLNGEPFVRERVFEKHVNCMGLKRVPGLL